LATGAGKTTVMAMIIAWQTVNAVRRPNSKNFTRGFLVVAPGLTIKDRLRVLQPNDPDSYYKERELVPNDMLEDINKAKIVVTNYHAFKPRERIELSKGGRQLLTGRTGEDIKTLVKYASIHEDFTPNTWSKLFVCENNNHPKIMKLLMQKKITPETFCVLDKLLSFTKNWNSQLTGDPVWEEMRGRMIGYRGFLEHTINIQTLKDYFSNGFF
jgi:hypothetical protein